MIRVFELPRRGEVHGRLPFAADAFDELFQVCVAGNTRFQHHEDRHAGGLRGVQLAACDRGDLLGEDQHEPVGGARLGDALAL